MTPAEPEEIHLALSRLSVSCRIEEMSDAAWAMRLETCIEDLSDVPSDILHEALAKWRAKQKFWPMTSDLRELIDPLMSKRRIQIKRLRTLRNVSENPAPGSDVEFMWLMKVSKGTGDEPASQRGQVERLGDVVSNRFAPIGDGK